MHLIFSIIFSFKEDVTEPKLNFQNAPSKTNSLVNITWQYDEKATTKCALTTPSAYLNDVNCSGTQFTGNFTDNGFYTLWIYGMDESGNTGLTGQHNWLVGKLFKDIVFYGAKKKLLC